ncbi:hypothetical protein M0802_008993 [Mischocyttarus mexicanus]|nr:hypothetical protein M0802_008993 [Mischocyttarus mexicanus]
MAIAVWLDGRMVVVVVVVKKENPVRKAKRKVKREANGHRGVADSLPEDSFSSFLPRRDGDNFQYIIVTNNNNEQQQQQQTTTRTKIAATRTMQTTFIREL